MTARPPVEEEKRPPCWIFPSLSPPAFPATSSSSTSYIPPPNSFPLSCQCFVLTCISPDKLSLPSSGVNCLIPIAHRQLEPCVSTLLFPPHCFRRPPCWVMPTPRRLTLLRTRPPRWLRSRLSRYVSEVLESQDSWAGSFSASLTAPSPPR